MAIDLTPEQKDIGKANFDRVVGQLAEPTEADKKAGRVTRRDFMKGLVAAGAVVPVSAAAYYGYFHEKPSKPVKVGLIGAGDEGGVLVGFHNPNFTKIVAVCDIRPTNVQRIFEGEAKPPRLGLNRIYGNDCKAKTEDDRNNEDKISVYEDYKKLLEHPGLEAVIIALPLHLHAPVAIDAMKAKKHVLCEKLMAHNIKQCKEMIEVADETGCVLSIGHQRHYSLMYAHCVEVINAGVLGDIKHIRALWHRNNSQPYKADANPRWPLAKDYKPPMYRDGWYPPIYQPDADVLKERYKDFGYDSLEQLVRWRLYNKTGGGLMAELGSHQLDACSIFLGKVHPLAVSGVGYKMFYKDDRDADDSIFVNFEFPGKTYHGTDKVKPDHDDKCIVTYSSINTNSFEPYGETVMGTNGSIVTAAEQEVMLYPERGGRSMAVGVTTAEGKTPALDSSASTGPVAARAQSAGAVALGSGTVSRGYREEMEHFAYCIRMRDEGMEGEKPQPRCHGRVAMADAIIALTANIAMKLQKRIEFDEKWFKAEKDQGYNKMDTPEERYKDELAERAKKS